MPLDVLDSVSPANPPFDTSILPDYQPPAGKLSTEGNPTSTVGVNEAEVSEDRRLASVFSTASPRHCYFRMMITRMKTPTIYISIPRMRRETVRDNVTNVLVLQSVVVVR